MTEQIQTKTPPAANVLVIGSQFRILRKLGSGSFGEIFQAEHISTGEEVAVKLEPIRARHPQLHSEAKVYKILQGSNGIANARWFGVENSFNVLVLDLLGPNMEELFNHCQRVFSLKTIIMIFDQLLTRLEVVHNRGLLHRDLKPENLAMGSVGRGAVGKLFLLDFGLAKRYREPRTRMHIPYREDKSLTGTARYASINAHLGCEQSRRDDLEAAGYVCVYWALKGTLPWQGLKAANKKQKYERIAHTKLHTSVDQLTKGLPSEFAQYLDYCRGLRFDETPDYMYLRQTLRQRFRALGLQYDFRYDWTAPRPDSKPDSAAPDIRKVDRGKGMVSPARK